MKTAATQVQRQNVRIEEKLDKIAELLQTLIQIQEEEYPPESKMRRDFIRRAERLLAQLKAGKLKMTTYRDFADFDRSVG